VRKRGDEFWKEFEFYLSDMLVGEWQTIRDCLSPYLYVLAIDPTFKPHPRHALNKAMTALFWSIIISILSLKLPVHFRVHLGPFCAGV
jgi:hypothetical protein